MNAICLEGTELERFIRTLMETIHEGLIVINTDGEMWAISRTARTMFGYNANELLGRNVNMLMPSPHCERHDSYIRSYLETGNRKIIGIGRQINALHKDGHEFPIHLAVGDATIGEQRVFLGFIEDISIDANHRSRIRALNSQLAHASRITSMGLLASAIAHELNQPLTAIQNYAETLAALTYSEGPIDRALLREAMQACTLEATRAGEFIRRFRHFMTSGEIEHARASLTGLVGEALALALADGEGVGVQVKLQLDHAADEVLVGAIETQQVVFNLARNALQAMAGKTNPLIRIGSIANETMVEVIVEDTGPGLSPGRATQLVQPFVSDKPDGLGMGLLICRTIVEGHGGRLWATQSDLGGAAFHFTVPRWLPANAPAS